MPNAIVFGLLIQGAMTAYSWSWGEEAHFSQTAARKRSVIAKSQGETGKTRQKDCL